MKRWICCVATGILAGAVALMVGCDWSAGGSDDGFNTSEGAGVNVNISGVYHGNLGGGRAVAETSGQGAVFMLTISQGGNRVDVTDNQGSTYVGTVGAPGAVAEAASGTYPAGAELVQYQINFAGKDEVAQRDVSFGGIIHVVSVTDIQGEKVDEEVIETFDETEGGQVITEPFDSDNDGFPDTTITTTTAVSTVDAETTYTYTYEYKITEANSQYRLEGTWVEDGGFASQVDALSAGSGGTITETTTEETTPAE